MLYRNSFCSNDIVSLKFVIFIVTTEISNQVKDKFVYDLNFSLLYAFLVQKKENIFRVESEEYNYMPQNLATVLGLSTNRTKTPLISSKEMFSLEGVS